MTSLAATVQAMADAGCTAAQVAAVVAAHEASSAAAKADKRAKDAERKRKSRANASEMSRGHSVTPRDDADKVSPSFPPSSSPPITPLTTTPNSSPSKLAHGGDPVAIEFDLEFWPAYPHKVGKPDAKKAFVRARRSSPMAAIMAGLAAYKRGKPADRSWLNPATFLNQERWNDEPAPIAREGPNGRTSRGDPYTQIFSEMNLNHEPDHHSQDHWPDDGSFSAGPVRAIG